MKTLNLTIRTPEKTIYNGEAQFVKFFTEQGKVKVYPHHSSVTGAVDFSPLAFVDKDGNEEDFVVRRGTVLISNDQNSVDMMVFDCEKVAELSPTTAEEYLVFIENELKKGTDLSDFRLRFYEEERYVIEKQIKYLSK